MQIWFNLSDPGTEDAIYDSYAMRRFVGIDFVKESVSDETTLLNFRHLLEKRGLNKLFFDAIKRIMDATGHIMHGGTIVDNHVVYRDSGYRGIEKREKVKSDAHLSTIDYRINRKTACRGLGKNENRLYAMFAYANLYMLALAGRKFSTI